MGTTDDLYDGFSPLVGNFKRGFKFKLDRRRTENQVSKVLMDEQLFEKRIALIYSTGMTEYHLR